MFVDEMKYLLLHIPSDIACPPAAEAAETALEGVAAKRMSCMASWPVRLTAAKMLLLTVHQSMLVIWAESPPPSKASGLG